MQYHRIMIFGRPGSGKSTFAVTLAKHLKLPVYHMDRYFYKDHAFWQERPSEEFLALQHQLVAQDRWIIDGNATKSFEMRYARAQIALYFCFPRYVCYWRVIKRLFSKDTAIKDRAIGCTETIQWSLLKYIWSFDKRVQQSLEILRTKYPHVQFYTVTNKSELNTLISLLDLQDKWS
jgi:adenylate kinase family enzyme